jgi:hypothetical protein
VEGSHPTHRESFLMSASAPRGPDAPARWIPRPGPRDVPRGLKGSSRGALGSGPAGPPIRPVVRPRRPRPSIRTPRPGDVPARNYGRRRGPRPRGGSERTRAVRHETVHGPEVTKIEQDQNSGLAEHPLPRPCEAPSVMPKTPPGASRGVGSSHSIPRGDGAVGPPRSGFVLRLRVRKADEAGGKPRSTTALRIQDSAESTSLNCRSPSGVGSRLRSHKTETRPERVGSLARSPRCPDCGQRNQRWRASVRRHRRAQGESCALRSIPPTRAVLLALARTITPSAGLRMTHRVA